MRLLSITRKDEAYKVKAEIERKFLGAFIGSRIREYTKKDKGWYELGNGKPVTNEERRMLDRWLKDHRKFIEHT